MKERIELGGGGKKWHYIQNKSIEMEKLIAVTKEEGSM